MLLGGQQILQRRCPVWWSKEGREAASAPGVLGQVDSRGAFGLLAMQSLQQRSLPESKPNVRAASQDEWRGTAVWIHQFGLEEWHSKTFIASSDLLFAVHLGSTSCSGLSFLLQLQGQLRVAASGFLWKKTGGGGGKTVDIKAGGEGTCTRMQHTSEAAASTLLLHDGTHSRPAGLAARQLQITGGQKRVERVQFLAGTTHQSKKQHTGSSCLPLRGDRP